MRHNRCRKRQLRDASWVNHAAYMDLSDVLRSRRAALGLSQAELAKAAGVSLRQLARYEAGEQQPVLSAAVALADALSISMDQLAGKVNYDLDLSGDWWCAWQTWKDGAPRIDTYPRRCISEERCSSSTPSGPSRSPKAATAGAASCVCGTTKPSSAGTGQPTPPCGPRAPCTSLFTSMASMRGAAG